MKVILSLFVLGLFSLQSAANGSSMDTPKPNNTDTLKLHDLDNSLKHHSGNIVSIKQELIAKAPANQQVTKEAEYSDSVLFTISEINNEVEDLVVKQNLLGAMESEQGKSKISKHKNNDTKDFKAKCGNYLNDLNLSLSKIKNVEITAEIKGARDDMVKICDIVQLWDSN